MRTLAGPDASLAFTNLSSATSASLSATFNSITSDSTSPALAHAHVECHEQGVLALMKSCEIPLERVCLLDPKASLALTPSDGDAGSETRFTWFLFGVRPVFCFFFSRSRSLTPSSHSHFFCSAWSGRVERLDKGYPRYVY